MVESSWLWLKLPLEALPNIPDAAFNAQAISLTHLYGSSRLICIEIFNGRPLDQGFDRTARFKSNGSAMDTVPLEGAFGLDSTDMSAKNAIPPESAMLRETTATSTHKHFFSSRFPLIFSPKNLNHR